MRLIDADALGIGEANRDVFTVPEYADGWNAAIKMIENAPTVGAEPVRHGHWIRKAHWCISCSYCGKYIHDYEGEAELYNYCPNCGADMRGGHIE